MPTELERDDIPGQQIVRQIATVAQLEEEIARSFMHQLVGYTDKTLGQLDSNWEVLPVAPELQELAYKQLQPTFQGIEHQSPNYWQAVGAGVFTATLEPGQQRVTSLIREPAVPIPTGGQVRYARTA